MKLTLMGSSRMLFSIITSMMVPTSSQYSCISSMLLDNKLIHTARLQYEETSGDKFFNTCIEWKYILTKALLKTTRPSFLYQKKTQGLAEI